MKLIHKCDRCGFEAIGKGRTKNDAEYMAEVEFGNHVCMKDGKPMRPLRELPLHLLREMAYKRLTEEQAFAIFDGEKA